MCGCLARTGDGVSAGPTGRRGRGAVREVSLCCQRCGMGGMGFFFLSRGGGVWYREVGSRSNGTGSGLTGARRRRGWINGEYIYLEADEWMGNGWAGGLVVTMAQGTEGGCGAVDVVVRCSMTMGSRRRRRWYWIPTALLFSWGWYGRWKGAVDVPPSTATVMERHRFGLQPHHPQPPTPSTPPLSPKTTTTTRPSKNTLLPPAQPTPSPGKPPTQRTRLLAELATRTSTYTHTTHHTHTTHTLSESHQPSPSHPSSSTTDPV